MPPKRERFNLSSGTVYFNTPEGLRPLEGLYTVEEIETEEPTPWPKENPLVKARDAASATFTATMTVRSPFLESLVRYARWVDKLRRLSYLARHGKNCRIRKKNWRRLNKLWQAGY